MAKWNLRDMDNRDGDGTPWEVTDTPSRLVGYLDGPVRSDLTDLTSADDLDWLIEAVKAEDITLASNLGKPFGIWLREISDDDE